MIVADFAGQILPESFNVWWMIAPAARRARPSRVAPRGALGLALARMSAGASFLRAVSPDSPRSQVGGLCEETLRRTGARFALSGALHPPGGHLQSSALSKVTRPRAIRHVSVVLRLVTSDRELTFEPNFLSVPTTKSISRMPACTKTPRPQSPRVFKQSKPHESTRVRSIFQNGRSSNP